MKSGIRALVFVVLATFALSCSTAPQPDQAPEDELAERPTEPEAEDEKADPIPRQVLFGDPDYSRVRLSPDGDHIAYLAPVDGVRNVWVAPVDDPQQAEPITEDDDRGIRWYYWTYADDRILYLQDDDGDENWTIYAVDIDDGTESRLTPESDVQARVSRLSVDHPDEMLVQLNDRDPRHHDVHRVDLATGESELVFENPGFASVYADSDLQIRMAMRQTSDGGTQWLIPDEDADVDHEEIPEGWAVYGEIPMEDALTTSFRGYDRSGEIAYAIDTRERNTGALVEIDFDSGEKSVLHHDERADVVDMIRHPEDRTVQAAAVEYTRKEWTVLDDEIAEDIEQLEAIGDGDLEIVDRTLDDDLWIAYFGVDDGPGRYYVYDRANDEAEFLFANRSDLEDVELSSMTPVVIESRDGLEMVSYLTVPHHVSTDADGMPEEALPLVLLVHGGPWFRDRWGYNPQHQWLADRGYAVLSVNFRGSTGFGKDFINASNKEWGAAMHDDLIDGVEWAVEEGITEPDRVAIMGGSYGGYATLAGMTFTPETFACGVNIVGPSNLLTLLESIPPYWEPMWATWTSRVGDPETDEGRELLKERSPLFYADEIQRPLLIAHGAHDPRVKQQESDQMVEAMRENDIPVTYVLYPDEGHGFARPKNRISFYAITEAFLSDCLDGRFEPIGDDFRGASLQVLEGIGEVPGLQQALDEE